MVPHHHRRRTRTYLGGFTRGFAAFRDRPISKARSTERLADKHIELQLDSLKRAFSTRDLSKADKEGLAACRLQIEEELEEDLWINKYKEVTIIPTIKFSIAQEPVMARPRSPSKSSCDTDLLDQTLLNIRKRLTGLSSDRAEMENKMDALMTGIKSVHLQCCQQLQQQRQSGNILQSSPQAQIYASIRRVRSSATPSKRPTYLSMTKTESPSTSASCSEECLADSPLSQDTGSTPSASSLSPMVRQRSESAAASLRYRPTKPANLSASCGSMEETWMPATPIHELPESPKAIFSSPFSDSSLVLQSQKSSSFRRSASVSSPPPSGILKHSNLVTSTPNISQPYEKREYYHTLPNMHSSHRNSLQDSVMNTVIPEDQVDDTSVSDNLSQLSTYTDDGSPRNTNSSAVIVRRSSLTGQIEQYRKPRSLNKKNSASMDLCEKPSGEERSRSRMNSCTGTKEKEFRVLNKGYRKSKRKSARISIILPSIETTV